jgi:hypothetical protein
MLFAGIGVDPRLLDEWTDADFLGDLGLLGARGVLLVPPAFLGLGARELRGPGPFDVMAPRGGPGRTGGLLAKEGLSRRAWCSGGATSKREAALSPQPRMLSMPPNQASHRISMRADGAIAATKAIAYFAEMPREPSSAIFRLPSTESSTIVPVAANRTLDVASSGASFRLRAPDGTVELSVRVTEAGPVLAFQRLASRSPRRIPSRSTWNAWNCARATFGWSPPATSNRSWQATA